MPPTHLVQSLLPSQQLLLEGALHPLGLQLLLLLFDQLIPATVLQDPLQFWLAVHTQAPGGGGGRNSQNFFPSLALTFPVIPIPGRKGTLSPAHAIEKVRDPPPSTHTHSRAGAGTTNR